ncbi:hypothetical protein, partial [Aetokthonos hydrillicola]|uniref:hypothetical protein n=1 Tax=Aetokthonos hydrillicola TaxID=1550245 RepID=UPI003BB7E5BA
MGRKIYRFFFAPPLLKKQFVVDNRKVISQYPNNVKNKILFFRGKKQCTSKKCRGAGVAEGCRGY